MNSIDYTVGACSFDWVLVAQSSRGICAILLGDDPGALISDLFGRFPQANFVRNDNGLADALGAVIEFVEDPRRPFDLPIDLVGTAFQQTVWDAIRGIPVGHTASYSEMAADIGMPRAARAVARACAANALAVVIPCHRVIRSDGTVAGYRWGADRRMALLKREQIGAAVLLS